MSTREIGGHLRDLYGIDVSPDLISAVTDAVLEEISAWQARPLEAIYPLVFFDALRVKIQKYRRWSEPRCTFTAASAEIGPHGSRLRINRPAPGQPDQKMAVITAIPKAKQARTSMTRRYFLSSARRRFRADEVVCWRIGNSWTS